MTAAESASAVANSGSDFRPGCPATSTSLSGLRVSSHCAAESRTHGPRLAGVLRVRLRLRRRLPGRASDRLLSAGPGLANVTRTRIKRILQISWGGCLQHHAQPERARGVSAETGRASEPEFRVGGEGAELGALQAPRHGPIPSRTPLCSQVLNR
jgi:hypothetical protein